MAVMISCNDEDSQVSDRHDDGEDYLLSSADSGATDTGGNETSTKAYMRMPDIVGVPFFGTPNAYIGTSILQDRTTEWYPRLGFLRLTEALNNQNYNSKGQLPTAVEFLTFGDTYIRHVYYGDRWAV